MADVIEYKCPACGGAMEFDSKSQKMKCPYCDTEIAMDEFLKQQESENQGSEAAGDVKEEEAAWENKEQKEWQEGETDNMRIYVCESCGGEIIADDNTGATTCPYCGNRVVMKGQFSGDLRPDYIIPFKYSKKEAKEAYKKHLTGKAFLPTVFKRENHIDEIKGVYVPFWLFDTKANGNMEWKAEDIHSWTEGNTQYTERKIYSVGRCGDMQFDHIPADASKKMEDTLMESIEPFDFSEAVPFQPAYLAGYIADRYDVEMEERVGRVKERVENSMKAALEETVTGYDKVTNNRSAVNVTEANYSYALYPVWMLSTTWHDKNFIFAMNGQTGKMVGDLPADNGAFWRFTAIATAIFGVIAYLIIWIIMLV